MISLVTCITQSRPTSQTKRDRRVFDERTLILSLFRFFTVVPMGKCQAKRNCGERRGIYGRILYKEEVWRTHVDGGGYTRDSSVCTPLCMPASIEVH